MERGGSGARALASSDWYCTAKEDDRVPAPAGAGDDEEDDDDDDDDEDIVKGEGDGCNPRAECVAEET